jgi:hypothetical protein
MNKDREPQYSGERIFLCISAYSLILTAAAKLFSTMGDAHILDYPDPLLGLSNRGVLTGVAAVELAVVACLASRMATPSKHLSLAWLGGNFLLYRFALALLKPGTPCKCLGSLTEKLHIDTRAATSGLTFISGFLLLGGLWFYSARRRSGSLVPAAAAQDVRRPPLESTGLLPEPPTAPPQSS